MEEDCYKPTTLLMNDDYGHLIPELAKWNKGDGISLGSWISGVGRFDHALGYTAIFWPDFALYEGCIFHTSPDPANFRDWMKSLNGDTAKVEAMMNHVHLVDLFANSQFQPSKALLLRLGQIMKEMWTCKLAQDFPERRFEVELSTDSDDVVEFEITFFQISNK